MGRRKFLSALGFGAVAAPGVGQQIIGGAFNPAMPAAGWASGTPVAAKDFAAMSRSAFSNLQSREAIRAILFEEYKLVGAIDHDIASKRSFSLAAKVTFQRQRNVERRIDEMQAAYPHERINKIIRGFLG